MIHLLPTRTLDRRFFVQHLPDELQLPLLNNIVVPRIVSSSMTPTLQEGDRLELSPPTSVKVRDIVAFRSGTMLVCHRVIAIDEQGILSTKGDATDDTCEVVQPSSVIGVVTGVLRNGIRLAIEQRPHNPSSLAQPVPMKHSLRAVVGKSVIPGIRFLSRFSLIRYLQATLLRWVATVDVLVPMPLQSFDSYATVASFTINMAPQIVVCLPTSYDQKPALYVIRLGSWRLAQYDQATESLRLRQSLRDAGLEPLFRRIFDECIPPAE